jgi:transposase
MNYKQGIPRKQLVLYNECIDNLVSPDSYVRVIDAYVERLCMETLGFRIPELRTGVPPYRNQVLLKIYIYGYLDRRRSSRRLEKECLRNKEMIWLTEGLAPDFKTIANFRKDNREGIRNVFKEFLLFCHRMNLLSFETVAVDSTTIRAQNSINSTFKRSTINNIKEKIQRRIDEYLEELDAEDKKEAFDLTIKNTDVEKILAKLKKLKRLEQRVDEVGKKFDNDEDLNIYFATDPDSRFQSDKGKVRAGYNVQAAGDEKNKLIIANEVTQKSNDLEQMSPMAAKIKEIKTDLNIEHETNVVMDSGYFSEKEIVNNKDEEGINILVPDKKEAQKNNEEKKEIKSADRVPIEGYEIQNFKYDKENDIYICPLGRELHKTHTNPGTERSGRKVFEYYCKNCDGCEKRKYCTNNKRGRAIKVSVDKESMDAFKESMKSDSNKKIMAKRKEIIEHPFGTLKRNFGYTYFIQRGLEKVRTEFSFMCFIYNFKRVLNMFTVEMLLNEINTPA